MKNTPKPRPDNDRLLRDAIDSELNLAMDALLQATALIPRTACLAKTQIRKEITAAYVLAAQAFDHLHPLKPDAPIDVTA